MRKLLVFILLLIGVAGFGQIKLKAGTSIGGTTLDRGGEFDYIIYGNGNGDATTRQLLFDLQYDKDNFEIVSVGHTGTGGNGGILPQSSTINISHYNYPGYSWAAITSGNSANNTTNGTTNYQYAQYAYSTSSANAILRVTLTWATTAECLIIPIVISLR